MYRNWHERVGIRETSINNNHLLYSHVSPIKLSNREQIYWTCSIESSFWSGKIIILKESEKNGVQDYWSRIVLSVMGVLAVTTVLVLKMAKVKDLVKSATWNQGSTSRGPDNAAPSRGQDLVEPVKWNVRMSNSYAQK